MMRRKDLKIFLDWEHPQDTVYWKKEEGVVELTCHPVNFSGIIPMVENFFKSNGRGILPRHVFYDMTEPEGKDGEGLEGSTVEEHKEKD